MKTTDSVMREKLNKILIERCIQYGRELERYHAEPRGWSKDTLLEELTAILSHSLAEARREVDEKWIEKINKYSFKDEYGERVVFVKDLLTGDNPEEEKNVV